MPKTINWPFTRRLLGCNYGGSLLLHVLGTGAKVVGKFAVTTPQDIQCTQCRMYWENHCKPPRAVSKSTWEPIPWNGPSYLPINQQKSCSPTQGDSWQIKQSFITVLVIILATIIVIYWMLCTYQVLFYLIQSTILQSSIVVNMLVGVWRHRNLKVSQA